MKRKTQTTKMEEQNRKICKHFERMIFEISKLDDLAAIEQTKLVLDNFSPDFKSKILPSILRRCSRYLLPYVMSVLMSAKSNDPQDFSLPFQA